MEFYISDVLIIRKYLEKKNGFLVHLNIFIQTNQIVAMGYIHNVKNALLKNLKNGLRNIQNDIMKTEKDFSKHLNLKNGVIKII